MRRYAWGVFVFVVVLSLIGWGVYRTYDIVSPGGSAPTPIQEKPFEKYSFERLATREYLTGTIEIGRVLREEDSFVSHMFSYTSEGTRISGQIHIPVTPLSHKMPVIVMARGYVDKEIYETGIGTRNAAAVYAAHGYVTLAPDFAGYGESDPEDSHAIGARLVKPVHVIDLISRLPSLPYVDTDHVYLWGHSNGGQIMLSVLEILGKKGSIAGVTLRGATLWAPVSKPFPYSVLFYSDEVPDKGKWLRREIANFESDYDVFNYTTDRYLDWITAPLIIHQGTADPEIPTEWSDELVTALREKDKDVTYHVYPGADHNMRPTWNTVVARDLEFFALNGIIEP